MVRNGLRAGRPTAPSGTPRRPRKLCRRSASFLAEAASLGAERPAARPARPRKEDGMRKLGARLGSVILTLVLLVGLSALPASAATPDAPAAAPGDVQLVAVGTALPGATALPDPAGGVTALTSP